MESRMLNYAGEILLAVALVLSSVLFYWLVWTLNGLGKDPGTAWLHRTSAKERSESRNLESDAAASSLFRSWMPLLTMLTRTTATPDITVLFWPINSLTASGTTHE